MDIKKKTVSAESLNMTRLYARGKLTASEVGASAAAAASSSQSGPSSTMVQRLARAAPSSVAKKKARASTTNSARNVKRTIAAHCTKVLSEPYMVSTPMWDRMRDRQVRRQVAFLPPHEVLDNMVEEGEEDQWSSLAEAGQSGYQMQLEQWASRVAVDLLAAGPWLCLALWGDSAPLTAQGRNSLYLLTFTILSGVFRTRFWLFACTKRDLCDCGCSGKCTFDEAWKVVAWSCRALLVGRWPDKDHRGDDWTGDQPWRAKMAGKKLRFGARCWPSAEIGHGSNPH